MSILRRKKGTSDKTSKEVVVEVEVEVERSPELAQLRCESHSPHEDGPPSWPLPNADGTEAEDGRPGEPSRPSTAGGITTAPKKSFFLRRRSTSQGMVGLRQAPVDANGAVPPMPSIPAGFQQQPQQVKKKKFGALRKMFGIHD